MTNLKIPVDVNNLTDSERKHIPYISFKGNEVTVTCGYGIIHPMEEDHYIIYIELFQNEKSIGKQMLKVGGEPTATFTVESTDGLTAQALCNTHGTWESL